MNKAFFISLLLLTGISVTSAQFSELKRDPVGKWLFEASYAPEGFTVGTIDVSPVEKEFKVTMVFTANGYTLSGEKVRFGNDSLLFSIYMEGEDIAIKLRFDEANKMSGRAVYTEGEVPLLLTREMKKD